MHNDYMKTLTTKKQTVSYVLAKIIKSNKQTNKGKQEWTRRTKSKNKHVAIIAFNVPWCYENIQWQIQMIEIEMKMGGTSNK